MDSDKIYDYRDFMEEFYRDILEFIVSTPVLFAKLKEQESLFDLMALEPHQRKFMALDWFIFDYKMPDTNYGVLDDFIENSGTHPDNKEICRQFKNSWYGIFEVMALKTGKETILRELFGSVQHHVTDGTLTKLIQKGDVIIGRILPFEDIKIMAASAVKMPPEAATIIRINRGRFEGIKGNLTPADVAGLFGKKDKVEMSDKDRLLHEAGRAGFSADETLKLIKELEEGAKGTAMPTEIIDPYARTVMNKNNKMAESFLDAVYKFWNSLLPFTASKGPIETAVIELAMSFMQTQLQKRKITNQDEADKIVQEWMKLPNMALDGKSPEQAVIDERKQLGNPELRVGYSFQVKEICAENEKEKEAEKLYNQALELGQNGKHAAALKLYKQYCELSDINHVVHHNMAVSHFFLGHYKKAKEHLEKALKLKPDYEKALRALKDLKGRGLG